MVNFLEAFQSDIYSFIFYKAFVKMHFFNYNFGSF